MANTRIQAKRTSTSGLLPNTTNSGNLSYIAAGEFAVNLTDQKVLSSNGTLTFEVGANLSALAIGTAFIANSTQVTIGTGVELSANGGVGSAGQVLTSNGATGSPYWSTSGGSFSNGTAYTWSANQTFNANVTIGGGQLLVTNATESGNATSGAVLITGGLGVANNIYTGGRVGFSNATNVSVVYQYYNATTNSLDTVFG